MRGRLRRQVLSALVTAIATGIAYLACAGGLFWVLPNWQIAIFCGAISGLAAGRVLEASVAAPVVVLVLAMLQRPWYVEVLGRPINAPEALLLGMVSGLAALAVSSLRLKTALPARRSNAGIAAALLVMVVANLWIMVLTVSHASPENNGSKLAATLAQVPEKLAYSSDAEIYLRIHHLMKQGMPYYDAVRDAWLGNAGSRSLPWGVVSYRLPTLFWLWKLLPAGGTPLIPAFLVFATIAAVSAFLIPAQLGLVRLAPVAAVLLAGNYSVAGITLFITYVDPWAMALTLAGIAALVGARVRQSRSLIWLAVSLMVAAALIREILIYVPALIALSFLLPSGAKDRKDSLPWLSGLAVFAAAYIAHAMAIGGQVAPTKETEVWTQGSLTALGAAAELAQTMMLGKPWFIWAMILLGAVGAVGLRQVVGARLSLVLLLCATVPLASLAIVGNPGVSGGTVLVNYWGMLCIPINLALVPASVLLLKRTRDRSA